MYFTRISLDPSVNPQHLAQVLIRDVYREHQALWGLFDSDPDAKRDFLYRQVIENGHVKYYVVSQRAPIDSSGIWSMVAPKHYDPKLREGEHLSFSLRANPVVTVTSSDGKKQRHDVVMHEKMQSDLAQKPLGGKSSEHYLIQTSCLRWLQNRQSANGFEVLPGHVSVEGYRQHLSRSKRSQQPVRFSSVDFQGILTVTDPEIFRKTLFEGIGKSKAFGCGLLLVRRY